MNAKLILQYILAMSGTLSCIATQPPKVTIDGLFKTTPQANSALVPSKPLAIVTAQLSTLQANMNDLDAHVKNLLAEKDKQINDLSAENKSLREALAKKSVPQHISIH